MQWLCLFKTIEELNGQRGKHHWDQTKGTPTLQSRIKYLPAIQQSRLTERDAGVLYTRRSRDFTDSQGFSNLIHPTILYRWIIMILRILREKATATGVLNAILTSKSTSKLYSAGEYLH